MKIRAQINEIDNIIQRKPMKPKARSLKRSTKLTNFQLDGLRKKKTQRTKMRNESGDITINLQK